MTDNLFTIQSPAVKSLREIEASLRNYNGLVVRNEYDTIIGDYRRDERPLLWNIMIKDKATDSKVTEITRDRTPTVGFVNRDTLSVAGTTAAPQLLPPVTIPGQDGVADDSQQVKAVIGIIESSHFAQSLQDQQKEMFGITYRSQLADSTNELIKGFWKMMHEKLFDGNATANALEFNGLRRFLLANHIYTFDAQPAGTKVSRMLDRWASQAQSAKFLERKITHIICSEAGALRIRDETVDNRFLTQIEIVPGIKVDALMCGGKEIPIIKTPFVNDIPGATVNDPDTLNYFLVNEEEFYWKGIVPAGGANTLEPQVFDVMSRLGANANDKPMVQQRMLLIYGTPFMKNRNQGLYLIRAEVPNGGAFPLADINIYA